MAYDKQKWSSVQIQEQPSRNRTNYQRTKQQQKEFRKNGYIQEYAEKYGEKVINIKMNPLKKPKKVEYKVEIENQQQLKERIAKLDKKLKIKDDVKNKRWFFESVIDGKRHPSEPRYVKCSRDKALTKINLSKQEKLKELFILIKPFIFTFILIISFRILYNIFLL